jgi:catechol 2,3-dioxygenase-like lactoylglutathione lyase family enzyme
LSGVLETSIDADDLGRAVAFYQRVFGFPAMYQDHRMCALEVPGGQVLLLFQRGASAEAAPIPGGVVPGHDSQGTLHLCFAIPLAELGEWEQHLARQGIAVESRVNWRRGGTSIYFRDPDGHSIEVATPGLWPNF